MFRKVTIPVLLSILLILAGCANFARPDAAQDATATTTTEPTIANQQATQAKSTNTHTDQRIETADTSPATTQSTPTTATQTTPMTTPSTPTPTPTPTPAPTPPAEIQFPDKPDPLTINNVVGYAQAYEQAYVQKAVANETSDQELDLRDNITISGIRVRQATANATPNGFTVHLQYVLNYTATNKNTSDQLATAANNASVSPLKVTYFVNDSVTRRTIALGERNQPQPKTDDPPTHPLPEKPADLTRETVITYVQNYEEAALKDRISKNTTPPAVTNITNFDVHDTTILNRTANGFGVRLTYQITYTAVNKEGQNDTGSATTSTDYFVNQNVTKRGKPTIQETSSPPASGLDVDPLIEKLFKGACKIYLRPQLDLLAGPTCSIIYRIGIDLLEET